MAEQLDTTIRWIEIIAAIASIILIANILSRALSRLLKSRSFPIDTGKRIVRIVKYGTYAIGGTLIVIFTFDFLVGTLVGLGFLGLAIGFGLANVISNFAAGISVMVNKSVVVGDDVKVGFFEGRIIKITITKTVLETGDGEIVYVPNSYFLNNPVSRKKHLEPTDHKHDIEQEGIV